jgi:tyrosyl-tRNA synthetase
MVSVDEQIKIIAKGADEIINLDDLRGKLERAKNNGAPLIVKLGLDPTAPDIHLGHTVVLRKIKQLQDLGHKAVIIIGDFTGMIGDPTGRSKTRTQLTREEVMDNAVTYKEQIFKIIDEKKTEVRFNSEWLSKLNFGEVMKLTSNCTVAKMLEREDFKNRFQENESIGVHEFLYPLMQGYDSIVVQADIELGGTEQRFNILMGRSLQKNYGQESQVAIFMPILEGTDGIEKMSKSLGNYIGINEEPNDIYGKVMSIPDSLIIRYFELATDVPPDDLAQMKVLLESGRVNPRDLKMKLAKEITSLYHGSKLADSAEEHFRMVFQRHEMPQDIPEYELPQCMTDDTGVDAADLLVKLGFSKSNSEARRLILQGGLKVNGNKIDTFKIPHLRDGDVIRAGRLNFARIRIKSRKEENFQ